MTKNDFIRKVAEKTGESFKTTEITLKTILDEIIEATAKGDKVSFVGFGSFETVERSARTARVPGTDKTVEIPAKKAPKFKAGKAFKEAVL